MFLLIIDQSRAARPPPTSLFSDIKAMLRSFFSLLRTVARPRCPAGPLMPYYPSSPIERRWRSSPPAGALQRRPPEQLSRPLVPIAASPGEISTKQAKSLGRLNSRSAAFIIVPWQQRCSVIDNSVAHSACFSAQIRGVVWAGLALFLLGGGLTSFGHYKGEPLKSSFCNNLDES